MVIVVFFICYYFSTSFSVRVLLLYLALVLPRWLGNKESACQCKIQFDPWVGKIPQRRKLQPTPVCLPGKSHEQRSLAGYSPWGHKRVGHDLASQQQEVVRVSHFLAFPPGFIPYRLYLITTFLVRSGHNWIITFLHTAASNSPTRSSTVVFQSLVITPHSYYNKALAILLLLFLVFTFTLS